MHSGYEKLYQLIHVIKYGYALFCFVEYHDLTFSSFGKKKKGIEMTIREAPQIKKPPHHIPIQRRSEESAKEKEQYIEVWVYLYHQYDSV